MRTRIAAPLVLALAGLGAAIVLIITAPWGAALSPDSILYVSVARNLIEGHGFTDYAGNSLLIYAPLYPMMLAGAGMLTGQDPGVLTRICNAFLIAFTIMATARLLPRSLPGKPTLAVVGLVATAVSIPLHMVSFYAWSEMLFILLLLLGANALSDYLNRPSWTSILGAGLFVGAAAATRYPGLILIVWGVAVICLLGRATVRRRVVHTGLFVVFAIGPLAPWFVRNLELSGTVVGERLPSALGVGLVTYLTGWTLAKWFGPVVLIIGLIGLVRWKHVRDRGTGVGFREGLHQAGLLNRDLLSMFMLSVIYTGALMSASVVFAHDRIGDRLLAPAYVPMMIVVLALAGAAMSARGSSPQPPAWRTAWRIGVGLWIAYQFAYVTGWIGAEQFRHGAGYASETWRNSPTVTELVVERDRYAREQVYTNGPDVLYWYARVRGTSVPQGQRQNSTVIASHPESLAGVWPPVGEATLVWFDNIYRPHYFSLPDLEVAAKLQPRLQFEDGSIFDMERR